MAKSQIPNRWTRDQVGQATGEVRELATRALNAFGGATELHGVQEACLLLKYLRPGGCDVALAAHQALMGFVQKSLAEHGMVDPEAAELLGLLHDYIEDFSDWGYVEGSWLRLELGGLHAGR